MSEVYLPEEWVECELEMLAKFIDYRGRTPKKTPNGIPLITAKNIRDGYINREPYEYIAEADYDEWMTRGIPKLGDIVITTEAPMGNVALVDIREKFALAQRAICLQCYLPEIGSYFHYALRSPMFQKLLTLNATGTTVSGIKAATLKKLNVPVPPLAEQKVIADKLDTLLAQVGKTKARLDSVPKILKRFRQAVLAAAVSGKLTKEWRELNSLDLGEWLDGFLGDFVEKPTYGSSSKSQPEGLVPVLRMGNLKNGNIDWTSLVYTSDSKEIEKYKLSAGDVLFNRTNSPELVGKTSIFRGEREAIYAGYLIRLVSKPHLNSEFLNYQLNSLDAKEYCYRVKSDGVSQSNINAQKLKAYPMSVPTMPEQVEIVRRVEELFAFADSIEQKANAALDRVNNLTQSILIKAFRGELTASWRDTSQDLISGERSAEALLKKIKAKREATKKQPKPKRRIVKKTGSRMKKQVIRVAEALRKAGEPLSGQQLLTAAGYSNDSSTEQLEQFFLDVRDALIVEKSIIKLERAEDNQDWFTLAKLSSD
ncbi:restriction endonuclease subunit S [Aliivibrio fischeri]|uniref:restriction endonuclease subunit S n=1 Tax=Aliivibrio fischeri TaxID=668 RepID=UPI0012D89384|nr:restriction endonuclease subunit S [Aliivibrio fischeri]MUK37241.1 restriction endonuclease subunit S [Aliivibrio fischeri]MUL06821.1 restriction endonuclease subunit S [Aliivibrio fischeri]